MKISELIKELQRLQENSGFKDDCYVTVGLNTHDCYTRLGKINLEWDSNHLKTYGARVFLIINHKDDIPF